jgi:hypothetical protein
MARRKSIQLSCAEVGLLQDMYLRYRTPSDQYKRRPQRAARFLKEWNRLSGRSDSWEDVIHYIITRRKNKQWVTFGTDADYDKLAEPNWNLFSESDWTALEQAYREVLMPIDLGSDNLTYSRCLAAALARRFAAFAGRSVQSCVLMSLVMSKRKRGEWVRLRPPAENDDLGFSDIDQVA